jgi:lauroyl/myristoyl acyltransferase
VTQQATNSPDTATQSFSRGPGDIQAAVVNLVRRLAPAVPVASQSDLARKIAEVIGSKPSTMANDMFLRQSIIRGGTATRAQVVDGLAAWITVLFDIDNLQHDRRRALDLRVDIPDAALDRVTRALSRSRNGCIIAVPHIGGIELFASHLKDRGFDFSFVYTIGDKPTPLEQWIYRGRSATGGTPIAFGRPNTGFEISKVLRDNGIVLMVVDVYPTAKYSGIRISIHGDAFNYPPGPARFAETGTLVLPAFASCRDAQGFSMNILDPIDHRASPVLHEAATDFSQRLASRIASFSAERPESYWLWHPIPNDPYLAIARRKRPDLLELVAAQAPDDEAVALAVEAAGAARKEFGIADPFPLT